MIDSSIVGSPGWWFVHLMKQLAAKQQRYAMLDAYYRCENGIPTLAPKAVREAYRRLMRMARTNFAELIVEAVQERMEPIGFRTGAVDDPLGDKLAWEMWQANSLDADVKLVFRTALSMSDAYLFVGDVDDDTAFPRITPEDPRQCIVETFPGDRRRNRAGLKWFGDDATGVEIAYLYLHAAEVEGSAPDGRAWGIRAERKKVQGQDALTGWAQVGEAFELPTQRLPLHRVVNREDLYGNGTAEFEPHIPILDRIGFTVLSRMEIATMQAFKQRAVKGVPTQDEDGNDIDYDDVFAADPGALWLLPSTADIWESGQVDLGPLRQAIRDDVMDLAAVTRTPLYYLTPDSANGSAEGASLAREGLVFKTKDRITSVSERLEAVMAHGFEVLGDADRATRRAMEIIWAAPERYSLAERYDAASKAQAAGVPWRTVMGEVLQFTPSKIDEMESQRAGDALLAIVGAPATPTPQPVQ